MKNYRVPGTVSKQHPGFTKRFYLESNDAVKLDCLRQDEQYSLQNSDFLIIICSLETKKSKRIKQQVKFFQDSGKNNNILILLVRGEPGEAFPEELIKAESTDITAKGDIWVHPPHLHYSHR